MASFYTGNIPGVLAEEEEDWWTGAVLWSTLLAYRNATGDTAYDETIAAGLQWQTGSEDDFLPANWSATAGNEDQALWGKAALDAAMAGSEFPSDETDPQWLALAQTVFEKQSNDDRRVDEGKCEGALRGDIYAFGDEWNYVSGE